MIDESIMEKIIPLPDEDEEMEKVQGELEGEGFPITNSNFPMRFIRSHRMGKGRWKSCCIKARWSGWLCCTGLYCGQR